MFIVVFSLLPFPVRNLLVSLKSNNGRNMKNDTKNYITTLLATVMKKYGATPFFTVIVKKNGDITVSHCTETHT